MLKKITLGGRGMLKITVDESLFVRMFDEYGRGGNFSIPGRKALFAWFDELDEEFEFDVIGFCCDFAEYEDIVEFRKDYGEEYRTIEDIEEQTTVIPVGEESFIIQVF